MKIAEDTGDEVFAWMPTKCVCGAPIAIKDGFHRCTKCSYSYGPASVSRDRWPTREACVNDLLSWAENPAAGGYSPVHPNTLREIAALLMPRPNFVPGAKHTAGPWKVYERRIPHYLGGEHVERMIATEYDHPQLKGPLPVATVSHGLPEIKGGQCSQFIGIDAPDAQLMATAPELLEALRDMVSDHKDLGEATIKYAQSVIEKATK